MTVEIVTIILDIIFVIIVVLLHQEMNRIEDNLLDVVIAQRKELNALNDRVVTLQEKHDKLKREVEVGKK